LDGSGMNVEVVNNKGTTRPLELCTNAHHTSTCMSKEQAPFVLQCIHDSVRCKYSSCLDSEKPVKPNWTTQTFRNLCRKSKQARRSESDARLIMHDTRSEEAIYIIPSLRHPWSRSCTRRTCPLLSHDIPLSALHEAFEFPKHHKVSVERAIRWRIGDTGFGPYSH
jgi:hypothetical protein